MRIAWFSPVPPDRSGIAAYTQELLPFLQSPAGQPSPARSIDLFVDLDAHVEHLGHTSPTPLQKLPDGLAARAFSAQELVWRHRRRPYDLIVYQVGNARSHDYMWAYLFRYPGLLVLHDLQVHQARALWLLSRLEPRQRDYLAELAANHPGINPDVGHLVAAGLGGSLYRLWPMTRLAICRSRLTVVHNARLARRLAAEHAGAAITTIEMGVSDPLIGPDIEGRRTAFRARLGIPPEALVIGAFGGITAEKRIPQLLDSVAGVSIGGRPVRLLLAGARAAHYDVDGDVRRRGLEGRVHVTGYLPDEDLPAAIAASDVSACLRWPSNGETSASWLRALGAGRPTIVTRLAHLGDVPQLQVAPDGTVCAGDMESAVAVSVDPLDEPQALPHALERLCSDEALRRSLGANARRWWESHHQLPQMAARYEMVLEEAARRPVPEIELPRHLCDAGDAAMNGILEAFDLEPPL